MKGQVLSLERWCPQGGLCTLWLMDRRALSAMACNCAGGALAEV